MTPVPTVPPSPSPRGAWRQWRWRHWPRSLFARLALILVVGLTLAQALSFWLTMTERNRVTSNMMSVYIESEVASSVALLDHLPASERAQWLPRLARRSYRFELGPGASGGTPDAGLAAQVAAVIRDAIGVTYPLTVSSVPGDADRLQVHLRLSDGSPLTIDVFPTPTLPLSGWLPVVLVLQLLLIAGCCWLAVRVATRPLNALANAADTLGPDLRAERLNEEGPSEVARAARAFNAMQDRIGGYMTERMQILAAISHDLQTPITRMRLRVDTMEDESSAERLQQDLREMESLVKEGVTYARTLHGAVEAPRKVDLDALLDTLVCDYADAGQPVALTGTVGHPVVTRPQALRRIVGNLIDNALKYGGDANLSVVRCDEGIDIVVTDHGPGIPEDKLEAVFAPFVRLETSRNRHTGGTGLGLAIAKQLAQAMDARLTLRNRDGGGLEARLRLM
ncbi:sensor histidine kinase [Pandoraea pnomenusa]|uniref:histidine kinase n=1 Tax=Pandoraea pnomenusa TaxID=93220 RepID=A0ABY6WHG6_9BURK|nr:HAMP domain-containing sensor histidine kinase [Pandoraea pnomenusa]MBN9095278.1 HAMP domain-containing histidine kinase [Pandoraea pnomenusa]VVE62676.1 ATPase [Pandoraea pnomenusa]